ncbi:mucin-13 [Heliangelus exortis]
MTSGATAEPPTTTTAEPPTTTTTESPTTTTTESPTTTTTESPTTTTTESPTTTTTEPPTTTTTGSPTTTTAEPPTTTTAEPPTTTTTGSPTTTTTESPTTTTTGSPTTTTTGSPTTTTTGSPTTTTAEPPTITTTGSPTTTGTTSSAVTTPTAGNTCKPSFCGLAKCIALYSNYTCQCPYGYYYNNKRCDTGKTFPGVITLNEMYNDNIQNRDSEEYEIIYKKIKNFFQNAFKDLKDAKDFMETVIVVIELQQNRAANKINVVVTNLFVETTNVDNIAVSTAVENELNNSPYVSGYQETTNCAAFDCDFRTTKCNDDSGFPECVCLNGFAKSKYDDRSCSECSDSCAAEENEYCAIGKDGPSCRCLPNYQRDGETCVPCPVGYSGDNCSNNAELILIIVGTVLGALVLTLIVTVSVVSVRAKHKRDPEEKNLINPGYSNTYTPDGKQTTMFPRVQTTSGHGNPGYQPNNPYEMSSTNRGRLPERDYDDVYHASREPEGFRMPRRY